MPNDVPALPVVDAAARGLKRDMLLAAARVTRHHAEQFEARVAALAAEAPEEAPTPGATGSAPQP